MARRRYKLTFPDFIMDYRQSVATSHGRKTSLVSRYVHIPAGLLSPWLVLLAYVVLSRGAIPSLFLRYQWITPAVLMSLAAFVGERILDTVEPPRNRHHRNVVHWLGSAATLYVIWFFLTVPSLPLTSLSYERLSGLLAISFLAGYGSHFVLDYT